MRYVPDIKSEPQLLGCSQWGKRKSSVDLSRLDFFFSSRRRHTRFDCDWSSDVCSSELVVGLWPVALRQDLRQALVGEGLHKIELWTERRSEERRVGKESRSRGWPYH